MKMLRLAMSDEEQIRDLIQRWMMATKQGDVKTVLDLMTDDVVFMVAGQAPFGKDAFRKSAEPKKTGTSGSRFEGETTIEELKVIGDWAYT